MNLPDKEVQCHLTGFKKSCLELVSSGKCRRWMEVTGINPNTGEKFTEGKCTDDWLPLLLMENSQQQRQTGAEIEALRKVVTNPPPMNLQIGDK